MYIWVSTLFQMSRSARAKLKASVLEGMKYYNATWKPVRKNFQTPKEEDDEKVAHKNAEKEFLKNMDNLTLEQFLQGPKPHKVSSFDPEVQKFVDNLKNEKGFKFIGFSDVITYIKESGTEEQMQAIWEHPFGSAALLYKIEGLPALIIAGPDIELNDSIRNRIPANRHRKETTYGVTG